jgi:outer membrane protein assembly factor BamB
MGTSGSASQPFAATPLNRIRRLARRAMLRGCLIFSMLSTFSLSQAVDCAADTETATAADPADGWPHIRGPHFDGHADATKLVDSFPEIGPPVVWTRPLGVGYSSFACDAERAYTQYQTWGGQYLVCLDALTGKNLWEYRYEGPYDPAGLYPGPRATPTLALGNVYFSAPSGQVGCLNAVTGKLLWSVDLFDRFGVKSVEFGYSCSATVVDKRVLVPVGVPNASMVALDADTGRTLWQSGDDPISHVPALPIRFRGQTLIVGYLRNALVAYRPEDGSVAWRLPLSSAYDEHAAWPIYLEPRLWISAPFRWGSQLLELTDEPPGYRTVWKNKLMSNDVASSVLVDGHLYGFDLRDTQSKLQRPSRGQFRCVEFADASELWANGDSGRSEWKPDSESVVSPEKSASTSIGQANVLYADGKLVMLNDLGELILARADTQQYQELGRVRILGGEICWTPPALAYGRLYARNHSRAVCIQLALPTSGHPGPTTSTVADIPQTTYRDWSALILVVEPRFAMDVPSRELLWLWYKVTLGELCAAALLAAAIVVANVRWPARLRKSQRNTVLWNRLFWPLFWCIAFVGGAVGTTLVSLWLGQFVFTWPLCLFVALHAVVTTANSGPTDSRTGRWAARLLLVMFLSVCVAYYLICHRLGLAFEWVFLSGFAGAVPFLAAAKRPAFGHWRSALIQAVYFTAGYTAFYGLAVAILTWRYHT